MNSEKTQAKSKLSTWKALTFGSIRNTHKNNKLLIIIQAYKKDAPSSMGSTETKHLDM